MVSWQPFLKPVLNKWLLQGIEQTLGLGPQGTRIDGGDCGSCAEGLPTAAEGMAAMDKNPFRIIYMHFSLAWANLRAEGSFVLWLFVDSKGFPCTWLNQCCQQRGPQSLRGHIWGFPGCAIRGQLYPGLLELSVLGLQGWPLGVCPLNGGKQPQEEGGPTHHQNRSQPTGFLWDSQTSGICTIWGLALALGGNYFVENQSNFIYISNKSFKSRVLSWRQLEGRNSLLELELWSGFRQLSCSELVVSAAVNWFGSLS